MAKEKNKKKTSPAAGLELIPVKQAPGREGFDVNKWRTAIKSAEDPTRPSRTLMYNIFNDIMLDLHLTATVEKRIENIKGTELIFMDQGKSNEKINKLIDSPWFGEMLGDILEARFWGYTAAWIDLSGGQFRKYKKYDRRYIIPEKGLFTYKPDDREGISILEPPYSNYFLTAGKPEDLGLLIKATPWVLLKRGDISDWATFEEILAAPIRVGQYPAGFPEIRDDMKRAIGQSGAMPWYLIPEGGKLDLIHNNGTGSTDTYERFANFCDKQLSKGMLHATMTLDSEGGQYKGDVHQESESVIHKSDRRFALNVLNTKFKELLEIHGFNPGTGKFQFIIEEHICAKDRLDMDIKLNNVIKIPPLYFYEKYNIPIPEGGPEAVTPALLNQFRASNEAPEEQDQHPATPIRRKKNGRFGFFV